VPSHQGGLQALLTSVMSSHECVPDQMHHGDENSMTCRSLLLLTTSSSQLSSVKWSVVPVCIHPELQPRNTANRTTSDGAALMVDRKSHHRQLTAGWA
jgi:hypothetical protein